MLKFKEKIKEYTSLKEFVQDLILIHNVELDTYEEDILQCPKNRHRSLGDLHKLCESYYPCTLSELKKVLLELHKENLIDSLFCSHIEKRTYFPKGDRDYCSKLGREDEYGKEFKEIDYD